MRKIVAVLVLAFLVSVGVGAMLGNPDAQAKPQIPCTYRCINSDTYLCCLYPPPVGEVCTLEHYGCP